MHDINVQILQDLYDRSIDKAAVLELIDRLADGELLDDILKMSHRPVDIHTFIHDPYFMGNTLTNLWESTIASVEEVINGGYSEAIFTGSIGRAKCFAKDTRVVMLDGSVKAIQDIQVGDYVLGHDSMPRRVTGTNSGTEMMYRIDQGYGGNPYVVNESHILSLKVESGNTVNIPLTDYLALPEWKRNILKGWRPDGTTFRKRSRSCLFDPYLLGLWLGGGESMGTRITTMDSEVVDYLQKWAEDNGHRVSVVEIPDNTYTISGSGFHNTLLQYKLIGNKHIPDDYLTGTTEERTLLLAGLLDTTDGCHADGCQHECGSSFVIIQKHKRVADGIAFLCRSLGLRATVEVVNGCDYHNVSISGDTLILPMRVERRKAKTRLQKKNVNRWAISVTPVGVGEYYGITLDGSDRMFLLDDFTVVHNTTRATIICAYNLYTLSCYHHPQEALGLMPNSDLYVVMINRTDTLARKVTYAKFRKLIENIPYFRQKFMFDEGVESEMRFPKNIFVIPSIPSNENLLGLDVVSGIVDEANFYSLTENSKRSLDGGTYDQAEEIYHGLVTRIASRFEGIDPTLRGCLSVVSSFKHSEDFTSTRIKEVEEIRKRGEKVITYISTGSQWDFLPPIRKDGTRRFSEKCFKVAIGNKRLRSEIITDESPENVQGREVIDVPDNFLPQFQRNIEKALRDLAGRVSGSTGSYFSHPEVVWDAIDNWNSRGFINMFAIPEEDDGWDLNNGFDILNRYYRPQHAHSPRFMHMDLSLTSDWLGLAIGYSPNDSVRRKRYDDPSYMLDSAPNVVIEGMLSIRPPKIGEIQYAELRRLIYYILEKTRIPLKYVSADGFQSTDHLQILKTRLGVDTKKISVEGEEPYKSLKNTYDDARIVHPNHPVYMREILHVVQDEKTGRIDHLAHFCFTGETPLLLAGGETITFAEMDYSTVYEVVSFDQVKQCFIITDAVHPRVTMHVTELVEIELEDGNTFRCTPDHKWLTSNSGWVEAQDLKGDAVVALHRAKAVVSVSRVTLDEPVATYDITVPATETFCLGNGAVVHNSKDLSDAVCGVHANIQRVYATGELYRGNKSVMRGLYKTTHKTIEMVNHTMHQESGQSKRDTRKIR